MKKVKLNKDELYMLITESIKNVLYEEVEIRSFEYNGHILSIKEFNMKNEDDKKFIKQNIDTIWNILQSGYEKLGGFIGFQSRRDMLKKSPFFKIGFCDGEIITVTVYNSYFGGSKCVGATCVKDDRHDMAVILLELIIKHNIIDWDKWIWIEASDKIEEKCINAGAFNVPVDYVVLYLNNIPYEDVDEYHYKRQLNGKTVIKSIFGFKDRETFEMIKDDLKDKIAHAT